MKCVFLVSLLWLAGCAHNSALPKNPPDAIVPSVTTVPCPVEPPRARLAVDSTGKDALHLEKVTFAELPGWKTDLHGEALVAFAASCEKLAERGASEPIGSGSLGGMVSHWRTACSDVASIKKHEHKKARVFFENHFHPYAATGNAGAKGRITGYYVQPLRASRKRGGRYQFPLYKRPTDLVSVTLDEFVDDGRSRRVWGRLHTTNGRLVPYPTREDFRRELAGRHDDAVLLWLDSPADVVLVEIEGSGRATLEDGTIVQVAFAGKNGRKSEARGAARALRVFENKRGGHGWTKNDLRRARKLIARKASMVFFEIENREGAIGSQTVVLTPRRSLAVDRAIVPLSTPVWVDTKAPKSAKSQHATWRHLLIAQDTGGAILGSVRGDIYWGATEEAVAIGRRVNGAGRMWLLLPKGIPGPS